MSDKHKDVLIAAYLFEDLAKQDFDAVLKLAEEDDHGRRRGTGPKGRQR